MNFEKFKSNICNNCYEEICICCRDVPEYLKYLNFRGNAFPPVPVIESIIDKSTKLQRLEIELTEKGQEEMVYYALERRGSSLRELTIDLDKNHEDNLLTSGSKAILMADIMLRISELGPTGEFTHMTLIGGL